MESVLHAEPLVRAIDPPFSIGHHDYVFYGEAEGEDDERGWALSHLKLGSPLQTPDLGSQRNQVSLVKTIGYYPDTSRHHGNIYTETLHYFDPERKFLIPYRTKLRSGLNQYQRLNHLPSLNLIRNLLNFEESPIVDAHAAIVNDLLLQERLFEKRNNKYLKSWIAEDLSVYLDHKSYNNLSFNTADFTKTVKKFSDYIHQTPYEFSLHNLKSISQLFSSDPNLVPIQYLSDTPIYFNRDLLQNRLVNCPVDLKSYGRLAIESLSQIERNPYWAQSIADTIDALSLTDINIDLIVSTDNEIDFYLEHLGVDRFCQFEDNDLRHYKAEDVIKETFDGYLLNDFLKSLVEKHDMIGDEIREIITNEPIKLKLLKTLSDEAAILLYRCQTRSTDHPLCGVYFDLAVSSLAPLSVVPQILAN